MVRVTERAASALHALLLAEGAPPEAGVRLKNDELGRFGIALDAPQPGDEIVGCDETPVLIVDGAVAERLADMVVDFEAPKGAPVASGRGFILKRSGGAA